MDYKQTDNPKALISTAIAMVCAFASAYALVDVSLLWRLLIGLSVFLQVKSAINSLQFLDLSSRPSLGFRSTQRAPTLLTYTIVLLQVCTMIIAIYLLPRSIFLLRNEHVSESVGAQNHAIVVALLLSCGTIILGIGVLNWVKVHLLSIVVWQHSKIYVKRYCDLQRSIHGAIKEGPETPSSDKLTMYCDCVRTMLDAQHILLATKSRSLSRYSRSDHASIFFIYREDTKTQNGYFEPVVFSATNITYSGLLANRRILPSAVSVDALFDIYNDVISESKRETRSWTRHDCMWQFRDRATGVGSATGLVFGAERPIAFRRLFDTCLLFNFEYLREIVEPRESGDMVFSSAAGIPIFVGRRKIGVALFLSTADNMFFPYDAVYWDIAQELESLATLAMADSSLGHSLFRQTLRSFPERDERLASRFYEDAGALRSDFKSPGIRVHPSKVVQKSEA